MPNSNTTQGEIAVFRSLVALLMRSKSTTPWQQRLISGQYPAITATYFLLDTSLEPTVEQFIIHDLSRLLQQLNRNTEQQKVEYRGQIRGRIAWAATLKARYSQDYDPTRYVCREVRHQYNTPENQLLKYVIERISDCLRAIPETIWDGVCCFSPVNGFEATVTISTATRLGRMKAALYNARHSTRLRQVTLPPTIREFHLQRAETVRADSYTAVAHIYRRYQDIVLSPSWPEVAEIGKHVLPLPGQANEDSRLWIQLGADILRT